MATAVYSQTQLAQPSSSYSSESSFTSSTQSQDEPYIATFFCRALYDYQSADESSLSFRKGEIIEVLTRLQSGWWDGLLNEERGWFPSNYVVQISEEEADATYAENEMQASRPGDQEHDDNASALSSTTHSMPSMTAATTVSSRTNSHEENGNWLDGDMSYELDRGGGIAELAAASMDTGTQSSDFWVPQVTADGQIYYVNTQTGQQSRDLPTEGEDELSDADFGPPVPNRSRSATNVSSVYGRVGVQPTGAVQAGFGLPKRTGTPEPWVRRLADDGLTYFYVNKINGSVQWTAPEGASTPRANGHHTPPSAAEAMAAQQASRLRAGSTASFMTRSRSDSAVGGGAYSDDSDIDPMDRPAPKLASRQHSALALSSRQTSRAPSNTPTVGLPLDQTSAEKAAQALQAALAPPPPEALTELSQVTRAAVTDIVEFIQAHGIVGHPDDQRALELRIHDAVVAIRNLLLISSPPYGQIPHTLYPKGLAMDRSSSTSLAIHTQLKPTQRRVTATLSKLVLAALAAQYDAGSFSNDAPVRMEADALELERALGSFVLEVQRANAATAPAERTLGKRRLYAAFLPTYVGTGLFGGGAAGMWKGFGWIAHPEGEAPQRTLPDGVLEGLRKSAGEVEEMVSVLLSSLRSVPIEVMRVRGSATSAASALQAFLRMVSTVNLSKTIDIDGVNAEGKATTSESYLQSVHRARQLVRNAEAIVQALTDDGALLFVAMQYYPQPRPASSGGGNDSFQSIVSTLRTNIGIAMETLDALRLIGQEQAEKGQNDYRGSIDWRASRQLTLDPSIYRTLNAISSMGDVQDDVDDIVDWGDAFGQPKPKPTLVMSGSDHPLPPPPPPDSAEEEMYGRMRAGSNATGPPNEQRRSPSHRPSDSFDSTFSGTADSIADSEGSHIDDSKLSALVSAKSPSRADKIIKMFGDVPSQILINIQSETLPWYLRPNYKDQEILIDPDGKVRGGTVPALVERLTAHEHVPSLLYSKTFLMTFKSFTDIDTIFELLVQRFWIQPPEGLTSTEHEEWVKKKRDIIRTRVLNTFKTMIQDEDVLEKDDMYILDKMRDLVTSEEVSHMSAAKHIVALIERARSGENARAKTTTISLDPAPPPIVPRSKAKLKLLDFDPIECARQLTIIECSLFMKIKASECLTRSREQKVTNDNIAAAIETTNKIAHWVADTVLEKEDSRKRALIVKHFISIADRCRELRNFSSMIAIVSGLNSPHIRRLKRTWDQINQRFLSVLGTCEMTIDSQKNFNNYRQLLQRITPPCVPFIGVYLTTLTFIQDGAPNNLPGNLVNFRKRGKAAEVIQEIQKWQSKPFNFQRVDPIYDYIQEQLNKFNDTPDVSDIFWNRSLEREPREREDEKMARLLQETGFL